MAVYKVPQDVEAEDKFLGPLSFKQFLFAGGGIIFGYLTFLTLSRGLLVISPVFFVPMAVFLILAFPWSREQPTELILASRIRFFIKPRKRIWDQSGVKDLVTVNAPIRKPHVYTDGLSQVEVKSRLNALASMVDSRGWAVKNISGQPVVDPVSDRLVTVTPTVPNEEDIINEQTPDMLDEGAGEARQFDSMIEASEKKHKDDTLRLIETARKKVDRNSDSDAADMKGERYWFSEKNDSLKDGNKSSFISSQAPQTVAPQITDTPVYHAAQNDDTAHQSKTLTEEELLEKVHEKRKRDELQLGSTHHVKTVSQKAKDDKAKKQREAQEKSKMTHPVNPDILELSQSNDLSVQTIAHQANKNDGSDDGEVVISLH